MPPLGAAFAILFFLPSFFFVFYAFVCACDACLSVCCCCLCAIPAFYTYARLTGVQRMGEGRAGRRINTHSPSLSHTPWHSQVIIMRGMHIIIIRIFMIIPVICHSCCLHLRFPGLGLPLCPSPLFPPPCFACQLGKLCAIFNF